MEEFESRVESEMSRAIIEHPPEKWAKMDAGDMGRALISEALEVREALHKGDVDGLHGVLAEAAQCAVVAQRIFNEILRRAADT